MDPIELSSKSILYDALKKLHMTRPIFGYECTGDLFKAYIDINFGVDIESQDIARIWGKWSDSKRQTEESAAAAALKLLMIKKKIEFVDLNYNDKEHYKSLFSEVYKEKDLLNYKLSTLEFEHRMLKKKYNEVLEEYVAALKKIEKLEKFIKDNVGSLPSHSSSVAEDP